MMPATPVPVPLGSGMIRCRKIAHTGNLAGKIGMFEIDQAVDDRDRHTFPGGKPVQRRKMPRLRARKPVIIGPRSRALHVKFIERLRPGNTGQTGQFCRDGFRGAVVPYFHDDAVNADELHRPALDHTQLVLARDLAG